MILNGCCFPTKMPKIVMAFILFSLCAIQERTCYRIVEWKPIDIDESGSGHGEEDTTTETTRRGHDAAPKSRTSIVIWNGIESPQSTKQPKTVFIGDDVGIGGTGDDVKDIASSSSSSSSDSSSPLLMLQQLNPGLKISLWNPTTEPEPNKSKQQLKICTSNNDCENKQSCNLYSRKCERCRIRNEICRRDGSCCNGLKCLWGRCCAPRTKGTETSLCKTSEDCQPGLCCAKEHGLSICKKYLKFGDTCELPLGGLVFSLHHSCPCQEGLRCQMKRRVSEYASIKGKCIK